MMLRGRSNAWRGPTKISWQGFSFTKCHDIATAWAHHLSADGRERLSLVLLPDGDLSHAASTVEDVTPCTLAHRVEPKTARQEWPGFPVWPEEVTYEAEGYGIYPFWIGGANLFNVTDEIGALTRSSHNGVLCKILRAWSTRSASSPRCLPPSTSPMVRSLAVRAGRRIPPVCIWRYQVTALSTMRTRRTAA